MALSSTPATFASQSIARLLERLAYQVSGTAHSPTAEHVHDLRVAVRRFEQSLVAFREALPAREVKRIRRKLEGLMDRAGDIRDCDVAQKILAKCALPGAAPLRQRLAEERKAGLPALTAALRRWGSRRTSSKWRAALLPLDTHEALHNRLPKLARKFLEHGDEAARQKVSAEELHAFRIEGKKFRYTLELLLPVNGAPAREWLAKLKPLQSVLGDVHDCRMARTMAARFDAAPEVDDWLKKRQRRKSREFRKLWQENFGGDAALRGVIAALRHTPRKPMGRSAAAVTAAVRQA